MTKFPNTETRRIPVRPPTVASDSILPLAQSLAMTGIPALAMAAGYAAIRYRLPELFAVAGFFAVWSWLLYARINAAQTTIWQEEFARGEDLDGDGVVGKPRRPLIVSRPGATKPMPARLNPEAQRLEDFVVACYQPPKGGRRSNSVTALRMAGFSETEIVEFRDLLIDLRLATWRDPAVPQRGWTSRYGQDEMLSAIRSRVEWIDRSPVS